eukprot:CAMPEP_0198321700 /NCGR_PEP_ID=MMETSP1450-20131203/10360_1 /TAXON_ID=753684 ORGANISM="Madagascaria erythrocladiodes, Strain CCMP3234" /NCGR_SAMPLE_ID=MMETSP1450 /ASSEMBLY_ACC=CAM_ASM_001115 /LENGTH=231 /DNA_ID=CAMNT_0044025277 /DNA_START=505 /DNA_END=1200 /DNA_ORIENTATION=+
MKSWSSYLQWANSLRVIKREGSLAYRDGRGRIAISVQHTASTELFGEMNPKTNAMKHTFVSLVVESSPIKRLTTPSPSLESLQATKCFDLTRSGYQDRGVVEEQPEFTEGAALDPRFCRLCNQKFATPSNANRHMKAKHGIPSPNRERLIAESSTKRYKCSCGQGFHKKFNFRRHIEAVHKHRQDFACEFCGQLFSQRENRDRHIRRNHTRSSPVIVTDIDLSAKDDDKPS